MSFQSSPQVQPLLSWDRDHHVEGPLGTTTLYISPSNPFTALETLRYMKREEESGTTDSVSKVASRLFQRNL